MITIRQLTQAAADTFGWSYTEAEWYLDRVLRELDLRPDDLVLFLNCPPYTEAQLAVVYGCSRKTIDRRIQRVRRSWPQLARVSSHTDGSRCVSIQHALSMDLDEFDSLPAEAVLMTF